MKREQKKELLKGRMAAAANMPKDVVLGSSVITALGNHELCIENYRGIIEYTEGLIRIQTKGFQLKIIGKHLQIEYYTNDEMKIIGIIYSIEFFK